MIAPHSAETDREIAKRPLAKQPRTGFFAHSRLDSLLAAMAGVQWPSWCMGPGPAAASLGA